MRINPINNTMNQCRPTKNKSKTPHINSKTEIFCNYSNNVSFKKNKAYTLLMGGSSGAIATAAILTEGTAPMVTIPFISLSALCLIIGFVIDRARDKD